MRKMKDSGIEWIGEIPEDWEVRKLSYLFDNVGSGTTPNTSHSDYYEGTINWVNTGDLNDGYLFDTEKKVTKLAVQTFSALKEYDEDSIIIAMYGATIGKIAIAKMKFTVNQACCVLSKPINCYYKYIYYWLLQNKDNIISLSYGGGQPNISQDTIKSLKIQIPVNLSDQQRIADYLDKKCSEIDEVIKAKETTNQKLKEYRQSIIYEAVTKGLDKTVKMKDSGIEWIGEIPEDWEVRKLKYDAYLKGRIGWQGLKAEEFLEEGPYLVTGTDFDNGKVQWEKCYRISEERYSEAPDIHLKSKDLLITKDGTIGKLAYIENAPTKASLNSHLLVIRPIKNKFVNKFLYWVLSSNIFKTYTDYAQDGTIMNSLSQEKISLFLFACPDIVNQQRIADYLDKKCTDIDSVIKANEDTIEKLKQYRQSVIYEAVTGKVEV